MLNSHTPRPHGHAVRLLLGSVLGLVLGLVPGGVALAQPAELAQARLSGSTRLRVWGFEVYDARLWVAPGFVATNYAAHAFALELTYRRAFKGSALAERSISEMQRQRPLTAQQTQDWRQQLGAVFPNVAEGDRIMALYRPGTGVLLRWNEQPLGELRDPVLASRFMGIWLGADTSEPAMRAALLQGAATP